jgi:hypothetical protein
MLEELSEERVVLPPEACGGSSLRYRIYKHEKEGRSSLILSFFGRYRIGSEGNPFFDGRSHEILFGGLEAGSHDL